MYTMPPLSTPLSDPWLMSDIAFDTILPEDITEEQEPIDSFLSHFDYYSENTIDIFLHKSEFNNIIYCKTEEQLIKACAAEIYKKQNYTVYYKKDYWDVYYIGSHQEEASIHRLMARVLAETNNILVAPNHQRYPSHWIYYKSRN